MLQIRKLNKYYNKNKDNQIHVINDSSVIFPEVGFVCILGTSGSGKSTLLNCLCGIDKTDSGTIIIDDFISSKYKMKKFDDIRNRYFGYVFQNYNLINNMTVFNNVALSLEMLGLKNKEEINKRVIQALKIVKMDKYKNRLAVNLSGGEQQRVGIARAIVKDAKYILADEPTGNLDLKNTISIMKILEKISKTRLVVMVTHEKDLAYSFANVIIKISDGKIISYEQNEKNSNIEYIDENEIYLDELEENKLFDNENVSFSSYGKIPTDLNLKIKFVVLEDRLYIQTISKNQNIRLVDENSLVQFISGERKKEVEEETENIIPMNDISISKAKGISFLTYFKKGFENFFKLKFIKKVLLFAFLFSSLLLTLSLGVYRATKNPDEDKYMNSNRDIINVDVKNINEYDSLIEEIWNIINRTDVYWFCFNNPYIYLEVEQYYQSYVDTITINHGNIVPFEKVPNYNGMKLNKGEVILDKLLFEEICKSNSSYIRNYNMIIGKDIYINNQKLKVVDIINLNNYAIYTSYDDALYSNVSGFSSAFQFANYDDVITSTMKPNKGEVLVNKNFIIDKDSIQIGGLTYEIIGTFEDENNEKMYVFNDQDLIEQLIINKSTTELKFQVLSSDVDKTIEDIESTNIICQSQYELEKIQYQKNWKIFINILFVIAIFSFLAPLFMLYFLMKSNMISKIKEIGTYRALGMRKSSIYKMNLGEILSITCLFSIPGYVIALLLMYNTKTSMISLFRIDSFVIIISFILIISINILIGLIPIGGLLRKTPQEIIIKYDI